MEKKIEITNRKSAFTKLKDFCPFSMGEDKRKEDYLKVTEWSNGEGYDITIYDMDGEKNFSLTYGQNTALETCIRSLNPNEDIELYTTEEIAEVIDTVCKGYYAGREWSSKEQEDATKASFKVGYALALRHFKK
jgi:hypothetical protein